MARADLSLVMKSAYKFALVGVRDHLAVGASLSKSRCSVSASANVFAVLCLLVVQRTTAIVVIT